MIVTPIYAGIATLFFVFLSMRVVGARYATQITLGDGGDRALLRRQRVHGNFAEYVPLALLLMALAELGDAPGWALHLVGVLLIAGRLVHAWGVSREPERISVRVVGMSLTFTALIAGALADLGVGGMAALQTS